MKRSIHLPLVVVGIIAIFLGGTSLTGRWLGGARDDLTTAKIHTPDALVKGIVATQGELIRVSLGVPPMSGAENAARAFPIPHVREYLRELANTSKRKIRFDEAPPVGVGGNAGGSPYIELINALDEVKIIDLPPEITNTQLNRQLALVLSDLERPRTRKIAVLTEVPPEAPLFAPYLETLRKSFEVALVARDFRDLPLDADVLLIARPWALSPEQAYAVDQWLLQRGRAIIIADPGQPMPAELLPGQRPPVQDAGYVSLLPVLQAHAITIPYDTQIADQTDKPKADLVTAFPTGRPAVVTSPPVINRWRAPVAAAPVLPVDPPRAHVGTATAPLRVVTVGAAQPFSTIIPVEGSDPVPGVSGAQVTVWLETLLLPDALIDNKAAAAAPVTGLPELERQKDPKRFWGMFLLVNTLVVPGLVLLAGMGFHLWRRLRRRGVAV
jgi:ABC-type uncharacterized transport system